MVIRSVRSIGLLLSICALGVITGPAWALNGAVPAIHGDSSATGSRTLLGDGTNVIIGFVDSGIDSTHPALTGNDSLGQARLVAQQNFISYEPGNTGDDVFGHGTWVSSAALGNDTTGVFDGMATDARYINARVLDSNNIFPSEATVVNGMGFALDHGADILNVSLNFNAPMSNGFQQLDLLVDWAEYSQGVTCVICAGNISTGNGETTVRSPASAYNGIAVGRSIANYSRVSADTATATTYDGRMKPDLIAPGTGLTLANDDWEGSAPNFESTAVINGQTFGLNGCSFATPLVAGMIAQQFEAGATHGLSTNPLVVKATVMNSADKILNSSGNAWAPKTASTIGGVFTANQSLDKQAGAGQVNGQALAEQYLAGEMGPSGLVDPVGWDLNTIGAGESIDYRIHPYLSAGSLLTTTLTWFRHVTRFDGGVIGAVDAGDFFLADTLTNLDLQVFKNGQLFAEAVSLVDNLEHLNLALDATSRYTLRVKNLGGMAEQFALAWHGIGSPVPEPASLSLAALAALAFAGRRRRQFGVGC